ncbi:MAG: hypothetical protein JSV76_01195 [Candidatus Bathyarchaeota archaeon]|nr:MAG: hypothetical protein JSV76_01195 [Candidatus Bathyarchaeota archaeon]
MQKDAFTVAIVVLLVGILLIPISQLTTTEFRDRLGEKRIVQIPIGETTFVAELEGNTRYQLAVKGGLITPTEPVTIDVVSPDSSSFQIEFPTEELKIAFQALESSGNYSFTFESAYAGPNTRAEFSEILVLEITTHPYARLFTVGVAFIIVGVVFVVIGLKFPIRREIVQ